MAMSERVATFLLHAGIVDALSAEDDVVEVLSEVASLSEQYIPTLTFLMRPDNLTALVKCLLHEPGSTEGAQPTPLDCERHAPGDGEFPSYDQYALVFKAHWVICASGFSSQLIAALVGLQPEPRSAICAEIISCNSRDTMNLEALARFLNVFMDQYSPETLLSFFGSGGGGEGEQENQRALLETLLVLNYYEPIRDVLLRILNDLPETMTSLKGATNQILYQLAPQQTTTGSESTLMNSSIQSRIANDLPHQVFSRMLFTCDLLTDLIHERRMGSIGFFYVTEISASSNFASRLIDAALYDLRTLPIAFANESYTVKVLNSLLQQSQCGCVTKAAFLSNMVPPPEVEEFTQGSPHDDLPVVWKLFIARLPEFLEILQFPTQKHFKTIHVQVIYLMLPILNVSCTAVDRQLIQTKTMECVLELIVRFPQANILHCAISRLYIVALEGSPFMFGKELPAYRAANDPLRLHLLLQDCLDTVLGVFGSEEKRLKPPPAFLDIAISFDQALTTAQAHSPHLFSNECMTRWHEFRSKVLLPTQTLWEEQYEPPTVVQSPKRCSVAELFDPASTLSLLAQAVSTAAEEAEQISMLQRAIATATGAPILTPAISEFSLTTATAEAAANSSRLGTLSPSAPKSRSARIMGDDEEDNADVPTPLSALYNDEEKFLMLKVASTTLAASSD